MKKRLRNTIGTLFLVLAIAATQIPASDVEAVTSSASDFQCSGSMLVRYVGEATSVSVPDDIKEIGPGAFADDPDLYAVYLPEGLTKIDSGAFSNCPVLTVVDYPDSLKEIDNFAFSNCASLRDVTLGESLTGLGYGVYAGCTSLEKIEVDKKNPAFLEEAGVLYNQSKTKVIQALAGSAFTKYNMPASVKSVEPYAFWGCNDLRFVELSGSLGEIPGYAFSNCSGLENITIPVSVRSIGSRAFADCVNLREAVIPASVTSIQPTAFDGCPKLTIQAEPDSYAEEFEKNRDRSEAANAEYQDAVERVEYQDAAEAEAAPVSVSSGDAAEGNRETKEKNEAVPSGNSGDLLGSTSVVGGRAVVFIDNRQESVLGRAKDAFPESTGSAEGTDSAAEKTAAVQMPGEETVSENDAETAQKGGGFPKYTIVGDKIASQAYYQDEELQSYDIPDGVKEIGDFAFARTPLTKISIPDQVTVIGYGAFYHCDSLKDVTIPANVEEIAPYAFEKTLWLENWKNGGSVENFKIVGDGILLAYKGSEGKITIPEGVKQIAAGVFADHKGITDISLPNTLQVIGEEAFAGCSNLKSVSGGVAVREIGDRAFSGCPIATVRIPASVEKIGLGAYDQSACGGAADINAVVFLGNELPQLSYGESARRLAGEKYRTDAFCGIEVAVVGDGMTDFAGTVLDKDSCGFHGTIASLAQESQNGAAGTLHTIALTGTEGNEKIPASVSIYQKPYRFDQTEAAAELAAWAGTDTEGGITVQTDGVGLTGHVDALLPGNDGSYLLNVTESSQARDAVMEAYRTLYGSEASPDMVGYDIALYDADGRIPITKLGREKMQITMPVPDGMDTNALHVVCMDADGQLEELSAKLDEQKGKTVVVFETGHFSPYAIYHYENGQGAVKLRKDGGVLTSLSRKKDASPDTGDPIHPKWFLAVGLLALSMMTFFLKGNSKKTPGIM